MTTLKLLLFLGTQLLLPVPGYLTTSSRGSMLVTCQALRCGGLRGQEWTTCVTENCDDNRSLTERGTHNMDIAKCITRKCKLQSAFLRKVCAIYNCRGMKDTESERRSSTEGSDRSYPLFPDHRLSGLSPKRLAAFVRRGSYKGMWPDEFETRFAERGLWPDEYETRQLKGQEGANEGAGADDSKPEDLVRRARSDLSDPDEGNKKKSVKKRWSTRLCMESHCKNAHGKVQYFMCGKMHCHR